MSMQYCEFCDRQIDTDHDVEHFHEQRNGMCEIEQERLTFPIHCKDSHGFYKIISTTEALVVIEDDKRNCRVDHKDYEYVTHEVYDNYVMRHYEDIDAKEFFNKFTNVSNHLIRKSR